MLLFESVSLEQTLPSSIAHFKSNTAYRSRVIRQDPALKSPLGQGQPYTPRGLSIKLGAQCKDKKLTQIPMSKYLNVIHKVDRRYNNKGSHGSNSEFSGLSECEAGM